MYAKAGRLKLMVWPVHAIGAAKSGRRQKKEELLAALADEGALDADKKRAIPFLQRVGVVTSVGSAAHADFASGVERALASVRGRVRVDDDAGRGRSGTSTASLESLVAAGCDVIVCARGGGSEEDLSTFDDEAVVRAIARCARPSSRPSGTGRDTTLADLVADKRAKTPTASVDLVVPDRAAVFCRLDAAAAVLHAAATRRIAAARAALDEQAECVRAAVALALLEARLQGAARAPRRGEAERGRRARRARGRGQELWRACTWAPSRWPGATGPRPRRWRSASPPPRARPSATATRWSARSTSRARSGRKTGRARRRARGETLRSARAAFEALAACRRRGLRG